MADERRAPFIIAIGLTLVAIASAEIARDLEVNSVAGGSVLLLALVPIAYGALRVGLLGGFVPSLILGIYSLHYWSPYPAIFVNNEATWARFFAVVVLGVAMSIPMSAIKAREDRRRKALAQGASDLERRNKELDDTNVALEAFSYVVSHDLKEPVRAIENYLDAAREDWGKEEAKRLVDKAYDENRRLARMLQGLLDYGHANSTTTRLRPVEIGEVLRSDTCRARYERTFKERGVELEIDEGMPKVQGDEVIMAQMFGNVILNAVKHNPIDKPTVRVRAAPSKNSTVHVIVEDNGPGIPIDVIRRFRLLKGTRPATVKGGFGLVIAHRAAQRMGGRIWLEDGLKEGAQVHVELPAAR